MLRCLKVISFVYLFIACDSNAKRDYYENGVIKSETGIKNGIRNGLYREYYESGSLKMEARFVNDTLSGVCKRYYSNGRLGEDFNYHKGRLIGVNKFYSQNGRLKEMREYDSSGRIIDQTNYTDVGKIDYQNTIPIIYANKDTLLVNESGKLFVKLANFDVLHYKLQLLITSGFNAKRNPVDILFQSAPSKSDSFVYEFRTGNLGKNKIFGSLIYRIRNDSITEDVIHNFEYSYFVKSERK